MHAVQHGVVGGVAGLHVLTPAQSRQSRVSLKSEFSGRGCGAQLKRESKVEAQSKRSVVVVNSTAAEPSDLRSQMRQMREMEQRLQSQVTDGRVKGLSAKEAGYQMALSNHVLLDVRPEYERKKSWVKESVWIPAFDEDKSASAVPAKVSRFLMGGWWAGGGMTKRNERFMPDLVARIPKSANIIVACQKGMRSLAACEQLYKAGYRNLFWLNGGFESAEEGDFEREGDVPLKFAGIGGMSAFLGWTDVQRQQGAREGLSYRINHFLRLVAVVIIADGAFIGLQQLGRVLQEIGRQ